MTKSMKSVTGVIVASLLVLLGGILGGRLVYEFRPNRIYLETPSFFGGAPAMYVKKGDKVQWYDPDGVKDTKKATYNSNIVFEEKVCEEAKFSTTEGKWFIANGTCTVALDKGYHIYRCPDCGDPGMPGGGTTMPAIEASFNKASFTEKADAKLIGAESKLYSLLDPLFEVAQFPLTPELGGAGFRATGNLKVTMSLGCDTIKKSVTVGSWNPVNPSPGAIIQWVDGSGLLGKWRIASTDAKWASACSSPSPPPPYEASGVKARGCTLSDGFKVNDPPTYSVSSDACPYQNTFLLGKEHN